MKTAVLIPCYNEAKTIEKVIKDFKKSMPNAVIYVYDNNSTDGTDEIAGKREQSSDMSISREKAMLCVGCSGRLTQTVIL